MKKPEFYCEGCGEKVDKWAVSCPKCGRVFDSIKCPQCNYTGNADQFTNGCPACGFQSKEQKLKMKQQAQEAAKAQKAQNAQGNYSSVRGGKSSNIKLSSIFYKVSIGVLVIVIVILAGLLISKS